MACASLCAIMVGDAHCLCDVRAAKLLGGYGLARRRAARAAARQKDRAVDPFTMMLSSHIAGT